jgi:signal transduction histidine kinase
MTIRLVTLMSVVLLLSLGAFGLLVNHYQDQVTEEMARVAAEAGRAALSTLEGPGGPGDHFVYLKTEQAPVHSGPALPRLTEDRRIRVVRTTVGTTHAIGVTGPDELPKKPAIAGAWVVCNTDDQGKEKCESGTDPKQLEFIIRVDGVKAEPDPVEGLVLKVPTLTAGSGSEPKTFNEPATWTRQEDIRLPIPLADFEGLYATLRRRSLWIFLGVFAVGTALSAGLAARFTRPIRRLDAAIRKLSAGDLDVQVDPRGRGEYARLGRAFNDMTRSLRANRQRARELLRREKHAALGRLAAGVAHDVRNPLHSIGLTLEHVRESCAPTDQARAAEFERGFETIRGEIRRLDQLVGNFLRFARTDVNERRPVDLRELLVETERLVRKEAEWRNVRVGVKLPAEAPTVLVDAEAVRSSVLNLVLNSFEAMPQGGELTLALAVEGEDAVIEVADTGAGIAAQDQDRVFEFAYTTREGGTGLGLAMVHQCVVEDHGGRVTLDSAPGQGTRVRLALPLGAREVVA